MQSSTRKRWPWIAQALAILAGAAVALVYRAADATAAGVRDATMHTPVTQDGVFEFTVTSVDCSRACTLGIAVHNLTATSRTPGIAFARAVDSQGAGYLPDAAAEIRAGSALFDPLAPDARITDRLIFDVPPGRTLTSVVLHESPSSAGIRVDLS